MRRHSILHRIPAAENQILTLSLSVFNPDFALYRVTGREQRNLQQLALHWITSLCGFISS